MALSREDFVRCIEDLMLLQAKCGGIHGEFDCRALRNCVVNWIEIVTDENNLTIGFRWVNQKSFSLARMSE